MVTSWPAVSCIFCSDGSTWGRHPQGLESSIGISKTPELREFSNISKKPAKIERTNDLILQNIPQSSVTSHYSRSSPTSSYSPSWWDYDHFFWSSASSKISFTIPSTFECSRNHRTTPSDPVQALLWAWLLWASVGFEPAFSRLVEVSYYIPLKSL